MILLDPDLEPDPAPKATSAKRKAASGAPAAKKEIRLALGAHAGALSFKAAQAAVRLKGEVTVLLTTDAAIRKLNRQFRGKNKATDVLSFPAEGVGAEEIAGDLAISVPTAMRQAAEQGHSLSTEIKVLILHGLLHLAGGDHEADDGKMARRERLLRGRLGLPQGLIERAKTAAQAPEGRIENSPGPLKSPTRLVVVGVESKRSAALGVKRKMSPCAPEGRREILARERQPERSPMSALAIVMVLAAGRGRDAGLYISRVYSEFGKILTREIEENLDAWEELSSRNWA
jgi:probable rRNA maturation factor